MPKELVISAAPHETRVAILEDGQLCEIYIEREKEFALVGSIYKGRVTRVLPGMQSAFVDIGLDSDAFLYVSDFLENLEEYDHVVLAVEDKVQKMEQQGGEVFAPSASGEMAQAEIPPAAQPPAGEAAPAPPVTEPPTGPAESQTELHAPPAEPATGQPAGRLPDSLYATLPPEQPSERVEEEHLNPPSAAASPAQEIRSVPSAPLKA